jgi:site-specific DNA-methyltransferase (cytosine-N4-specific)
VPSPARKRVATSPNGKLTHHLHPYAAKFHPSVPRALIQRFARPGDRVLDPFAGSGTTLVEALVHGCSPVGVDIHPLAVLVSRVKTTLLPTRDRNRIRKVADWSERVGRSVAGEPHPFEASVDWRAFPRDVPEFDNRDHWFLPEAQRDLGILRAAVRAVRERRARDVLWVALSTAVMRASRQDSETRYKAVDRPYADGSALLLFAAKARGMLAALEELAGVVGTGVSCEVHHGDVRERGPWFEKGAFDLVVTSPPYANSYDYYLYHKQRMNWIGLDFRVAKDNEIGSRLEFSSQRAPIEKFFADMTDAFANVADALVPGGRCVVVQGDSRVAGVMYAGDETIRRVARRVGLAVQRVTSADQAAISRAFNPQFAVVGKREHVVVLRKKRR